MTHTTKHNAYYDLLSVRAGVEAGHHRGIVGGLWDEIGSLQLAFLRSRGLQPQHTLLDVGCGCLRGGVHLIPYLEPGHYFGLDLNQLLLDAGYEREVIPSGLSDRLPRSNLICNGNFDFGRFGVVFDYALALSLFTHLPLNTIRVCLERLVPFMRPYGMFFATFFEIAEDRQTWHPVDRGVANIVTHGDADPYHYRVSDLAFVAAGLPWAARYVGAFEHPRKQVMMAFERMPDSGSSLR